jgi:hypothetical protein
MVGMDKGEGLLVAYDGRRYEGAGAGQEAEHTAVAPDVGHQDGLATPQHLRLSYPRFELDGVGAELGYDALLRSSHAALVQALQHE